MAGQRPQTVVEVVAETSDLLGVGGDLLLAPAVGDGPQKRDQRRGRRDDDLHRHAVLDERWIGLRRGADERFAGNEHDDELGRRRELLPVRLGGQRRHVFADLLRVAGQRGRALSVARRAHRLEIGGERYLGVHDDVAAAGQVHDHVGTQPAVLSLDRDLLDVVAVARQPGQLDDPVERDLPPPPPHLRRAERGDEVAGLAPEPLAQPRQRLHLAPQAAVRLVARLLQLANPGLVARQRVFQRRNARVDLLLPVAQPLLGQRQELLVAPAQGVTAQRLERPAEVGARVVQQPALILEVLPGCLEPRARLGVLALLLFEAQAERSGLADQRVERCEPRAEVGPRHQPREHGSQDQADDDQDRIRHAAALGASAGRRF